MEKNKILHTTIVDAKKVKWIEQKKPDRKCKNLPKTSAEKSQETVCNIQKIPSLRCPPLMDFKLLSYYYYYS